MINIYEEIVKFKKSGGDAVLVTVVNKEGHGPSQIGGKLLVFPDGRRIGTVGGGALEKAALIKANQIFSSKNSILVKYNLSDDNEIIDESQTGMICGGKVTLFFDYSGSRENIYIFGAGHIGKSLIYHLKNLNFSITLYDCRKEELENINGVRKIYVKNYNDILKDEKIKEGSYIIVTTHSHEFDYFVLRNICKADYKPKYIGVVASLSKRKAIIKRLKEEFDKNICFDNLYMPVGLDIGGKTPDEIAISIIAEIQSIRYGRNVTPHLRKNWRDNDK
ncbi:MAG: XdhC family protein [Candidatus Cloacimonetes bacterium]|nr:XdhC family protein [Candidatus Cloacimonadota bacterium]